MRAVNKQTRQQHTFLLQSCEFNTSTIARLREATTRVNIICYKKAPRPLITGLCAYLSGKFDEDLFQCGICHPPI